jgi:peptide-methionine (R)-S-oxide reductase
MTDKAYAVTHSDAEWRRILTPEQYQVMRSSPGRRPGIQILDPQIRSSQ